jgi:MFS family permease
LFIFITVFVDLLGYGMIIPLLPFYVQQQDGGAAIVGALGSLYALMQLLSGPVLGALSDRLGRRPVLLSCLLGTALAYLMLGLADTLLVIFLAIMLDGITGGNLTTAYAYIADVTSPKERSRGMGLVGAAFGLGIMAGPAMGGLLSAYGMGVPAFVASAIALTNVAFGWLMLPESLPPERRMAKTSWRALNPVAQLIGLFQLAPGSDAGRGPRLRGGARAGAPARVRARQRFLAPRARPRARGRCRTALAARPRAGAAGGARSMTQRFILQTG